MRLLILRIFLILALQFSFSNTAAIASDDPDSVTVTAQPSVATALVLPPIMINPLKAKTISVKLGKVVVFTVADPAIWKGKVVDPKIAKFVAGGPKSTYETNPSLTLLKKGKTTVSLTDGKKTYLLKLTVS
ncbi:hypothetical protein DLE04_03710 [Actinobacteria bacterium IMCC26103]|nr:hypothetical protein DLE04_03710 [Actinobacteria bacterium IMCC26103]